MVLSHYQLSYSGAAASLLTATAIDFAMQHSAIASKKKTCDSAWLGHRIASIVLCTPVIGLVTAIFLRVLSSIIHSQCFNRKKEVSDLPARQVKEIVIHVAPTPPPVAPATPFVHVAPIAPPLYVGTMVAADLEPAFGEDIAPLAVTPAYGLPLVSLDDANVAVVLSPPANVAVLHAPAEDHAKFVAVLSAPAAMSDSVLSLNAAPVGPIVISAGLSANSTSSLGSSVVVLDYDASAAAEARVKEEPVDPFSFLETLKATLTATVSAAAPVIRDVTSAAVAISQAASAALIAKLPNPSHGRSDLKVPEDIVKISEDELNRKITVSNKNEKLNNCRAEIYRCRGEFAREYPLLMQHLTLVERKIAEQHISSTERLTAIIKLHDSFVKTYDVLTAFALAVHQEKILLGVSSGVLTEHELAMQKPKELYLKISEAIDRVKNQFPADSIEANYLLSPAIRYSQAPKSWAAYCDTYCKKAGSEKEASAMLERGKALVQRIYSKKIQIADYTPANLKDIMWHLMYKAVQKGQGYDEGSFIIDDPEGTLFDFIRCCNGTYNRLSSHPVGGQAAGSQGGTMKLMNKLTSVAIQQGIDVEGLPAHKSTILFDQLNAGKSNQAVLLKMENHGTNSWLAAWDHLKEYVEARKKKSIKGADDLPNMRKERIPARERDLFVSIVQAVRLKESCLKETVLAFKNQSVLGESDKKLHVDYGFDQCLTFLKQSGSKAKNASLSDMHAYITELLWLVNYKDPSTKQSLIAVLDSKLMERVNLLQQLLKNYDAIEDRFGNEVRFTLKELSS